MPNEINIQYLIWKYYRTDLTVSEWDMITKYVDIDEQNKIVVIYHIIML